jgi:UDP-N-acetylmuramoyl-tripeptide--D-alanyl-D-alanine ligase
MWKMFCNVVLDQLVKLLDATPIGLADQLTASVDGISTDTRSLNPGQVFLALRGERFDGHEFVRAALKQGAIAAIVDTAWDQFEPELPLLQVENTLSAYQAIAHWWRQQFSIPVIAITGSVGKTTTKELIAAVLATQGRVLKTQGNNNNEIGVAKTLLELEATHDYAVIEMGMRAQGEIELLTQIACPDIAVITNVGTAHIGRLGSEQAIAAAKCELLAELSPHGIAVLNHDNTRLMTTAAKVLAEKTAWTGKTLTYGLEGGDLHGHLLNPETLILDELAFSLPLPGRHNALNYLAALAIAKLLQIDWLPLTQGLTIELPSGRARRETLPNDIVLLDETYNAGLESMLSSLHLLAETPGQRHIAVLGTMKELGERSPEFHHQVGTAVRQLHLDHLLILADPQESEAMAAGAFPLNAERFASHTEVVSRLVELVRPGDRLLFKASRAVGLDQVVQKFQAAMQTQTAIQT